MEALFYRGVQPSDIKKMGYHELKFWFKCHENIIRGEEHAAEKLKGKK